MTGFCKAVVGVFVDPRPNRALNFREVNPHKFIPWTKHLILRKIQSRQARKHIDFNVHRIPWAGRTENVNFIQNGFDNGSIVRQQVRDGRPRTHRACTVYIPNNVVSGVHRHLNVCDFS